MLELENKKFLANKVIRKIMLVVIDAILVVSGYVLMNFFTRSSELLQGPGFR